MAIPRYFQPNAIYADPPLKYNILDVGSGDKPLKEADCLCDKYLSDNRYRGNRPLNIGRKPFVLCDVEALPFPDKSFNFIYCNRVLEFTENPEKGLKEIKRVGVSGYVHVPSVIFPSGKIRCYWGAYSRNNRLIFVRASISWIKKFPIRFSGMLLVKYFTSLINLITGIFSREYFWGNGLESFIKICRSNNKELRLLPLFLIKIFVIGRIKVQDLRDRGYILN